MTVQGLTQLFDYMYWANCQMWQCIMSLDEQQRLQPLDYSIGSIHSQLAHMVTVDNLWINFLWHGEVEFLKDTMFPSITSVRAEWDALEEEMRDYLSTLTDDDLEQVYAPGFLNLPPLKLSDILLQLINHATDHRAQILAGIHQLGGKTVEQDYINYVVQHMAA